MPKKQKQMHRVSGTRLIEHDGWCYQVFMPRKIVNKILGVFNTRAQVIVCDCVPLLKK